MRVSQSRADRENCPILFVRHQRYLGKPLNHTIVVHNDEGVGIVDLRNAFHQCGGKVKMIALPVASWKVLSTPSYSAIGFDHSRATNPDQWREAEFRLACFHDHLVKQL